MLLLILLLKVHLHRTLLSRAVLRCALGRKHTVKDEPSHCIVHRSHVCFREPIHCSSFTVCFRERVHLSRKHTVKDEPINLIHHSFYRQHGIILFT